MNIYNDENKITSSDSIYDAYNTFILSSDRNILYKLLTRHDFFNRVKDLPGDIVECGVFKGSGIILWAKLLDLYSPHDIRKVIGFDFFDASFVESIDEDVDRVMMTQVFDRCPNLIHSDISEEGIKSKFERCGIPAHKYELVKGDIVKTSKEFAQSRPGFRISLLYLDLDLDMPTYETLKALWDRVVPGGIVVFDEYAYHMWSESNAVDRFLQEKSITLHKTNVKSPTAYILKE